MDEVELKKALVGRRAGALESMAFSMAQSTINQVVMKLDLVRHRMTLKWGFNRLHELASPELQNKWSSHMKQLEDAMIAENVPLVEELVDGGCRGWAALERAAEATGHIPFEPMVWEVVVGETVYQVVRSNEDAAAIASRSTPERPVVVLEELVRVYHLRHQNVFSGAVMDKKGEYVPSGLPMDQDIGF
mgnify:CR=1 FL=1